MRTRPNPYRLDRDKLSKVIRHEILVRDADGNMYLRVLEGVECEKWQDMMTKIYELFSNDPEYPKFHELKWQTLQANPNIFEMLDELKKESK